MRLLSFKNNKVIISPEIVSITPFKEIWEKDKSKDKEKATNKLKYLWFYIDYESPYFKYSEKEKHEKILTNVLKDTKFKVDEELKVAMDSYRELNYTPAIETVDSAMTFVKQIQKFFKTVDLNEVKNAKQVTDIFANMPKIIASLNEAKAQAEKEQSSNLKVRGGAVTGMFEG